MKTKTTYINLVIAFLFASAVIAQTPEGLSTNSESPNREMNNSELNQIPTQGTSAATNANKLAAAELMNYQAVARDNNGDLMVNQVITVDFQIRDGAGGPAVFDETQNLNTDMNGVFSAAIGSVSSLVNVNWLDIDPWLAVRIDGTAVGETAIGSVATSLHSKQSAQVLLFGSGTNNPDKMIAQHSPAFPGWGIGYEDASDVVHFMAGGVNNASVSLGTGSISTEGNVTINSTTTNPAANTVYGNSMPIAFGSIDSLGGISSGYGITSVNNSAVGVYEITINLPSNPANTIVTVTPFTIGFGVPEIAGYETTGANTFTVRIQDNNGNPRDSAFAFTVFGE